MQTRVAQVIDRLVVLARALPNHRGPEDQTGAVGVTTVFDGPEIRSTDDLSDGAMLIIGYPGDNPDELVAAANSTITYGPIAATNRPRDEVGTIICRAISQRAETAADARNGALAEVEAVAAICRADPSLALNTADTIGGVRTITFVTAGDMFQYLDRGYTCEWEFSVTFKTRV